jgi:hypothetical protein
MYDTSSNSLLEKSRKERLFYLFILFASLMNFCTCVYVVTNIEISQSGTVLQSKNLGNAMIPGNHIVSCHINHESEAILWAGIEPNNDGLIHWLPVRLDMILYAVACVHDCNKVYELTYYLQCKTTPFHFRHRLGCLHVSIRFTFTKMNHPAHVISREA